MSLLRDFNPEVVVLDIGLPFMDGYEVCKQMRAIKRHVFVSLPLTGWGQRDGSCRTVASYKSVDGNMGKGNFDSEISGVNRCQANWVHRCSAGASINRAASQPIVGARRYRHRSLGANGVGVCDGIRY